MASLRVSPDGHSFEDGEGRPFFWLGDTLWELFRSFEPEDALRVLRKRKEQGFTVVQAMITGFNDGRMANAAGDEPWEGGDPARPREPYFRNVDRVLGYAGDLGFIVVLGVYHQLHRRSLGVHNARAYARWVSRRYAGSPHVVWTMYPEATEQFVEVIHELVSGLKEGDGGAHLITMHPDPSPASSSFLHEESWLDFNQMQPWQRYELQYPMVAADYRRTPPKPVVMAEGGYEGVHYNKVHDPWLIRRQAYWTYLAGGYHTYGHASSHHRPPELWPSWIDSPGASQMGVCRGILTSLVGWWKLEPDQDLFLSGEGEGMHRNVAARNAAAGWALVYLCTGARVTVDLSRAGGGRALDAAWIVPATGERLTIGGLPGRGERGFSTPSGWEDALLLFRSRG